MATQLTPLAEVERLSALVIRILGGNPGKFTLQGSNTYLVGKGPRRLLVDTGEGKPSWPRSLEQVLSDERATVDRAILTHWHPDHVGGVKDLLRLSPGTKVYKNEPSDGHQDIVDGQEFHVEGATLRAVHTPGHTTDHMALILAEEDAMFTGDNVLGHGTAVFEDLETYLASLESMRHRFSGRAYPGHGDVIGDGKGKIAEYIAHRQERESQVVEVLSGGLGMNAEGWEPLKIVKIIYKDVPESLHLPAQSGILQVLRKLEREGKVCSTGQRWRIGDRSTL